MYNREPELHTGESGQKGLNKKMLYRCIVGNVGFCNVGFWPFESWDTLTSLALILIFIYAFYEFPNFIEEQYKSSGVTLFTAAASLL